MLIGALEAGGTKMVCAVGKEDGTILEQVSIPTTTPEETIPKLIEYFQDKEIEALGVAAFGPVDVKPSQRLTDIFWTRLSWHGGTRIFWAGLRMSSRFPWDWIRM